MTAESNSKPYGLIYCITNKVNGKKYIGQTTRTVEERMTGHLYSHGANGCRVLSGAIKKYGKESFEIEALDYAECQDSLNALEVLLIEKYRTMSRDIGYNLSSGGGSGGKQLPETIALRVSKTKGKKRSSEFCLNLSVIHKGKTRSPETRAKISEAAKKRPPVSEETRAKLSACAKGRVCSEEQKEHMRKVHTGRIISEEQRKKISATLIAKGNRKPAVLKGKKSDPRSPRTNETRNKISLSVKEYWISKKSAQI